MSPSLQGAGVEFVDGGTATVGSITVVGQAVLADRAALDGLVSAAATDTDLTRIAALVDQHGAAALGRLRGTFAIAVGDPSGWRLVRDQLGTMPLYHRRREDGSVAAATSVARLAGGLGLDDLDRVGLAHSVTGMWGDPSRTLWSTIRRVPAGHQFDTASGELTDYWAPERRITQSERRRMAEVAADVRRLLLQATERALDGASTVGIELSGGFDSSTVAGATALLTAPSRQLAYTWSGADVSTDLPFAEDVARMHDLDLRRVVVGAEAANAERRAHRWRHAPGNYLIDEVERAMTDAVRSGATHYLTGHLGDLVFAGDVWLAFAEYVGRREYGKVSTITDHGRRIPEFVKDLLGAHPAVRGRRDPPFRTSLQRDLAATVRAGALLQGSFAPGRHAAVTQRAGRLRTPQPQRVMEILHQLGEDHGLNVRHPLVDVDLVEFMLTVPSGYLVGPPNNRCLHAAAIDGIAPTSVRQREDKAQFDWSAMDAIEALCPDDLLAESVLADLDVVDSGRAVELLAEVRQAWANGRGSPAGWELTGLIETETFLRTVASGG